MKGEGVDRWQFYSVKVRLTASRKEPGESENRGTAWWACGSSGAAGLVAPESAVLKLGLHCYVQSFCSYSVGATLRCGAWAFHCGVSPLWSTGSRLAGFSSCSAGLSCSTACEIFPDQGLKSCPLHWQAESFPIHIKHNKMHLLLMLRIFTKKYQEECL